MGAGKVFNRDLMKYSDAQLLSSFLLEHHAYYHRGCYMAHMEDKLKRYCKRSAESVPGPSRKIRRSERISLPEPNLGEHICSICNISDDAASLKRAGEVSNEALRNANTIDSNLISLENVDVHVGRNT
jgi:hypothetical protein